MTTNKKELNQGIQRYGLRPPQAAEAIGSIELFNRARFHGWIKPIVQQKRMTIFDAEDVALVYQRIKNGEIPSPIPRKRSDSK